LVVQPTQGGLEYWTQQTNGGADLSSLIGRLTDSPEYKARVENLSPEQVISSIYQSLFGRQPDAEGLEFYRSLLEGGGGSIETIAIDILAGSQGTDAVVVDNRVAAANLFTASLDTPEEIAAFVGDGAAEIARQLIQGVTADPATIPSQEQIDETVEHVETGVPPVEPPVEPPVTPPGGGVTPPQTFVLTTGVDSFIGGSADDKFNAASAESLGSDDVLDGGAGRDVLNISAGAIGNRGAAPAIRNIETINNSALGATLNLANATGVEQIWTDMAGFAGTAATRYNDASVATTFGIRNSTGTNSDVNINFAEDLAGNTTVNLALADNGAGSYAGFFLEAGVENASISVTDGNAGLTSVTGVANITVTGAGDFGLLTFDDASLASLNASAVTGNVTLTDTQGNTAGSISTVGAALITDASIVTGSGDDQLYLGASDGDLVVVSGAGNDAIVGGSGDDTFDGGAGADTITGGLGVNTVLSSEGGDTYIATEGETINFRFESVTHSGYGRDVTTFDFSESTGAVTVPLRIILGSEIFAGVESLLAETDGAVATFGIGRDNGTDADVPTVTDRFFFLRSGDVPRLTPGETATGTQSLVVYDELQDGSYNVYFDANGNGNLDDGDGLIHIVGLDHASVSWMASGMLG